jgi:hypothetical protein
MTAVSLIKVNFEQRSYESVIKIAREIPFDEIPLTVLPAVTHSYYEIGDYESCVHFGSRTLKKIIDNTDSEKRDIELTILAIIASYENKEETIKQYQYLVLYDKIGLNNLNVLKKLKSIETKLIRRIVLSTNIICFGFIAITYVFEPDYRKSIFYFLFVLVFFGHLAIDYFTPKIIESKYAKILRHLF